MLIHGKDKYIFPNYEEYFAVDICFRSFALLKHR